MTKALWELLGSFAELVWWVFVVMAGVAVAGVGLGIFAGMFVVVCRWIAGEW